MTIFPLPSIVIHDSLSIAELQCGKRQLLQKMRVSVSCATGGGRLFSFILQPVKVKMGGKGMASIIQIFGVAKSFDTKKAERYFKERRIKFQSIDLLSKGMSKGEFNSVSAAVGGYEKLIDTSSKAYKDSTLQYLAYEDDKIEKLLENPAMFKTPIVRNGRQATVGYCPDVWKTWE